MSSLLPVPWFARGHLLRRSREIASVLARHGLGWLVTQVGLGEFLPFERGWFGHPVREAPYTQAEHLRMAFGELGATFIKLGQVVSTRLGLATAKQLVEAHGGRIRATSEPGHGTTVAFTLPTG